MKMKRSYLWQRNILNAQEHPFLMKIIESWSARNNCSVQTADKHSPDLVAIPCFIAFVDPTFIGLDSWNALIEYTKQLKDEYESCKSPRFDYLPLLTVVTGAWNRFEMPELGHTLLFDLNMAVRDSFIAGILDTTHQLALSRHPSALEDDYGTH